ncbi:hypothetical protein PoB_000547800 [Plakobranchus ocellatus]|uniref:Uncharacterized protein n=1 Tax=Plakobranchus ocellatus TaxID=259542 RepID=A0AAV3Y951_9GAST|nr:hypothetical protein PoB_000547800 [Plakobranchus ocellatus]
MSYFEALVAAPICWASRPCDLRINFTDVWGFFYLLLIRDEPEKVLCRLGRMTEEERNDESLQHVYSQSYWLLQRFWDNPGGSGIQHPRQLVAGRAWRRGSGGSSDRAVGYESEVRGSSPSPSQVNFPSLDQMDTVKWREKILSHMLETLNTKSNCTVDDLMVKTDADGSKQEIPWSRISEMSAQSAGTEDEAAEDTRLRRQVRPIVTRPSGDSHRLRSPGLNTFSPTRASGADLNVAGLANRLSFSLRRAR